MDSSYILQRKIRALEERTVPEYKDLVFYGEDDLSLDAKSYAVKFTGITSGSVTVEAKFSADSEAIIKLNGAKMSAYKPVIGENSAIIIGEAIIGENLFEVEFSGTKPENITLKLSGYIKDLPDESQLTALRDGGKTVVCHYDDRRKKVFIYQYDGGLNLVHEEESISAAISRGTTPDQVTIFTVAQSGTLSAKTLDLTSSTVSAPTVIEEGVKTVSGSLNANLPAGNVYA